VVNDLNPISALLNEQNGRAAMIAMASLFAFKAIPGSVPIMDILGAQ
jgi:hypothetical protein